MAERVGFPLAQGAIGAFVTISLRFACEIYSLWTLVWFYQITSNQATHNKIKTTRLGGYNFMAERVGFEPTDRITTVTD